MSLISRDVKDTFSISNIIKFAFVIIVLIFLYNMFFSKPTSVNEINNDEINKFMLHEIEDDLNQASDAHISVVRNIAGIIKNKRSYYYHIDGMLNGQKIGSMDPLTTGRISNDKIIVIGTYKYPDYNIIIYTINNEDGIVRNESYGKKSNIKLY
jgi:hypothetical protein